MGRTGSTFIQSLLAQDPANISPELWETIFPSPPPRFGIGLDRRERVSEIWRWYMEDMVGITAQHPYFIEEGFRALAECGSIGQLSLSSYQFFSYLNATSYLDWFVDADQRETVDFHHNVLQHLQWGREGRAWISKAVEHGIYLSALLEKYADGIFVWTHRDPLAQAASLASILGTIRKRCGVSDDPSVLGEDAVRSIKLTVEKGMAARSAAENRCFIDIYYPDLVADPVGTIRGLYGKIGRDLTAEAELNIERWLRANRSDKGGVHQYSAAEFGITPERIEAELGDYLARFGGDLEKAKARHSVSSIGAS